MSLSLFASPEDPRQQVGPQIEGYVEDDTDLLARLVSKFEESEDATWDSREMADKCLDYFHGQQWTAEEIAILRRRRQPPVVQNYVRRKVSLLLGLERKGRSDPKCFPRTPHEEGLADAATQVLRYIVDDVRYDVVRSSVYEDMLICGVGGCEVIAEPTSDNDFRVNINHVPFNRLFWDPHSAHPGFSDANFLGYVIWMDRGDALERYPGCDDILSATFESGGRSEMYGDRPSHVWHDSKRRRVRVVQIWWKRRAEQWWTATLTKGGFLEAPQLSPYSDRHGKPTCPIVLRSIYTDRELNRYGIVKDYLSTQDAINKRESRLLHALNVKQVIMEAGAVEDADKARAEVAKPDGFIVKNRGFEFEIHQDATEIQGQFELLKHAIEQMGAAGPNASMAGRDPRELSGKAIIAQQSGGMAEAEPLSDSLRQFSHKVYESAWCRAKQFWGPNKTIRVTDEQNDVQFVSLNHSVTLMEELQTMDPQQAQRIAQQMGLRPGDPRLQQVVRVDHDMEQIDVDISVEDGPDVPTLAAEQFQALMQLPKEILIQFPPSLILKASALRNKDELLQMLEEHQAQQAEQQAPQKQRADQMADAQIAKTQADAANKRAQAVERVHGVAADHSDMQAPRNGLLEPQAPPPVDPLAASQVAHDQQMDRARFVLDAQGQHHDQQMDAAGHMLAVRQALQPPAPPSGPQP